MVFFTLPEFSVSESIFTWGKWSILLDLLAIFWRQEMFKLSSTIKKNNIEIILHVHFFFAKSSNLSGRRAGGSTWIFWKNFCSIFSEFPRGNHLIEQTKKYLLFCYINNTDPSLQHDNIEAKKLELTRGGQPGSASADHNHRLFDVKHSVYCED